MSKRLYRMQFFVKLNNLIFTKTHKNSVIITANKELKSNKPLIASQANVQSGDPEAIA